MSQRIIDLTLPVVSGEYWTKYPGVYYIESSTGRSGKPERIFYIVYRRDGKLIEEKAGRHHSDNMTPAKAAGIRTRRMQGRELSNKERREAEKAVKDAFSAVVSNGRAYNPQAEILGVSIQPMLPRPDYELILGSKKDADFGPVILFGMGGVMTEVLKDQDIALPPLNRLLARRLIEGTRVYTLLKGYRNLASE